MYASLHAFFFSVPRSQFGNFGAPIMYIVLLSLVQLCTERYLPLLYNIIYN